VSADGEARWAERLGAGEEAARQALQEIRAAAERGEEVAPALAPLAALLGGEPRLGWSAALLLRWLAPRADLSPVLPALARQLSGSLRPDACEALLEFAGDDPDRRRRVLEELQRAGAAGETADKVARVCASAVPRRTWTWEGGSLDTLHGCLRWRRSGASGWVDQSFESLRAGGPAAAVWGLLDPGTVPGPLWEEVCRAAGADPPPRRPTRGDVAREAAETVARLAARREPAPCGRCAERLEPALRLFHAGRERSQRIERCGACGGLFLYEHEYEYLVNGASEESESRTPLEPTALEELLVRARVEDGLEWGAERPGDGRVGGG
jgi:hypothetical protein